MDRIVLEMFENRSFDNLPGHLYATNELPSFEGVTNRNPTSLIPDYVPGAGCRAHGTTWASTPTDELGTIRYVFCDACRTIVVESWDGDGERDQCKSNDPE